MIPFSTNPRLARRTRASSSSNSLPISQRNAVPVALRQARIPAVFTTSSSGAGAPTSLSSSSSAIRTSSSSTKPTITRSTNSRQQQQLPTRSTTNYSSALTTNPNLPPPARRTSNLRQTFAMRQANTEIDQIERLGMTLERLNSQVSRQLAQAQRGKDGTSNTVGEDPESKTLVQRAVELNKRLRVLKHKLSLANDYYTTPEAMHTYSSPNELMQRNQQRDDLLRRQRQERQRQQDVARILGEDDPANVELRQLRNSTSYHQQQTRQSTTTTSNNNNVNVNDDEDTTSNNNYNNNQSFQIILQQLNDDIDPDDAPREFVCPISQCVMIDPVRTCDGHCYDRASIAEWFVTFDDHRMPTSPLTNLPLESVELNADDELREKILHFLRETRKNKNGGGGRSVSINNDNQKMDGSIKTDDTKNNSSSANNNTLSSLLNSPNRSLHSDNDEPSIRDLVARNKGVNISTYYHPTTSGQNASSSSGTMIEQPQQAPPSTPRRPSSSSSSAVRQNLAPAPHRPSPPSSTALASALAGESPENIRNLRMAYYTGSVRNSLTTSSSASNNTITDEETTTTNSIRNNNSGTTLTNTNAIVPPRQQTALERALASVAAASNNSAYSSLNSNNDNDDENVNSMNNNNSTSITTTQASAAPAATITTNANPIWSSSVVPSSEPNARALNLIRLDDTIQVPHQQQAKSRNTASYNDDDETMNSNNARTYSFLPPATSGGAIAGTAARIQNNSRRVNSFALPRHSSHIGVSSSSSSSLTSSTMNANRRTPSSSSMLNSSSNLRNLNQRRVPSTSSGTRR